MPAPTWLLVPWSVFAIAALIKTWQLNRALRGSLRRRSMGSGAFRASLERIWLQDTATSDDAAASP